MARVAQTWTVRSLLAWAREWLEGKGVPTPRLDAELLVAHALGCDRLRLYLDHDKPLTSAELSRIKPLLQRRAQREPVAYILGAREFYGRPFRVGPGVFIPRPETELLVHEALAALPSDAPVRALDLCAGSGAIGITLGAERPLLEVDLVDVAPAAIEAARDNAVLHAPGRVRLYQGDLFAALPERRRYSAVIANPPYVAEADAGRLEPEIVRHEPKEALFSAEGGFAVLRRIVTEAPVWLLPGAFFGVEIDPAHAAEARELCAAAGLREVRVVKDLAGLDRHVVARAP